MGAVGVPIVGMQLDALAGMQKTRGTQVGVRRSKPSPASNARSRSLPQLSLVAILEGTVERIKVVGVMNAVTPRKIVEKRSPHEPARCSNQQPLARQLMQFSHPQQSQMAQLLGITIFIPGAAGCKRMRRLTCRERQKCVPNLSGAGVYSPSASDLSRLSILGVFAIDWLRRNTRGTPERALAAAIAARVCSNCPSCWRCTNSKFDRCARA